MKSSEIKYFERRIHSIKWDKQKKIVLKDLTKADVKKAIKEGKYIITENIYGRVTIEFTEQLKKEAEISKKKQDLDKQAQDIIDKAYLGDSAEALKLLAQFEKD